MTGYSLRRLLWAAPLTSGLAAIVNLLYYELTRAMGEPYVVPINSSGTVFEPMPVIMVFLFTLVGAIGAILLFTILVKLAKHPLPPFLSISATALLVSFGGPFSLPAVTLGTRILLSGMHILAAVVTVGGLLYFCHKVKN